MNIEATNRQIGIRIRNLRKQKNLTQQELADRAELTKGFISQLERGQVSPSIPTLLDLIECLGTSPANFFKEHERENVVFGPKDISEKMDARGNSIRWLVPGAKSNQMEPVYVTIAPNSSLDEDPPHNGEEFGYVLQGRVTIHLGGSGGEQPDRYEAKSGESFYYSASRPHRLENLTSRETKILWISTPPGF